MGDTDAAPLFSPVTVGRASARVADQIRSAIRSGELRPGDRLPAERDLSTQFGVSRVTVRDALRTLEAVGLIEVRLGAQGGAFVTVPGLQLIAEGVSNMLFTNGLTALEVTEARQVFELGIIDLVCARADEDDLRRLEAICDLSERSLELERYDVTHSADFHAMLARCTHNTAIVAIIDSLQAPLHTSLLEAKSVYPQMGHLGTQEHRKVIEAIRDRDADAARRIMTDHLERTADHLRNRSTNES